MTRGPLARLLGPTLVSLLGIGLLAAALSHLLVPGHGAAELAVTGVGVLLAVTLVGAGVLLLRCGFSPAHTLRIAGWAVLGTVVLGVVLGLISLAGTALPLYASATLLAVSAFAHVLIGVRDVQRIRAEDVARQREKLAVLNRLIRHNLRHEAQRLLFARTELLEADEGQRTALAADIGSVAEELTDMQEQLGRSRQLIRREVDRSASVDLAELVDGLVTEYRTRYPAADIRTDVPADCRVIGGEHLEQAIDELLDNALVHGGEAPTVRVMAANDGRMTTIRVTDDGPGIPEPDRSVLTRETDITQLTHSQGLGLWLVRWMIDAYGGQFSLDATDDGTSIQLRVPNARS